MSTGTPPENKEEAPFESLQVCKHACWVIQAALCIGGMPYYLGTKDVAYRYVGRFLFQHWARKRSKSEHLKLGCSCSVSQASNPCPCFLFIAVPGDRVRPNPPRIQPSFFWATSPWNGTHHAPVPTHDALFGDPLCQLRTHPSRWLASSALFSPFLGWFWVPQLK